ncbi:MAG: M48 family metallopeptidase, partial [Candidatus Riflebacteria bacterium]
MKYVAKIIDEEDNYTHESHWWGGINIFVRIILVALAIYMFLGFIVDFAVPFIPISWENSLAGPIMDEVATMGKSSKKYDQAQVQKLLDSLSTLMPKEQQRPFKVFIVEKNEANALALPGGNIVVFTELLNGIKSENELAMILAHELGHFANRDHLRGLGRSFLFFIVSTALLGGDNSAVRSFMNSSGILTNTYSRAQENNADRYALNLLVKKYGHAGGATDFFKRMAGQEMLPQLAHYLSTHPASNNRVAKLEEIIAAEKYEISPTLPP